MELDVICGIRGAVRLRKEPVMFGNSFSIVFVWAALINLSAATSISADISSLYYSYESNLVATAVSYRYSLCQYSSPVFTFNSPDVHGKKANGVLFYVNKPECLAEKFFFLNVATNNVKEDGVEEYFTVGRQYYFKLSEIEDQLHMSICPKDLVSLTTSKLWSGRHWGFPFFSVIQDAHEHKVMLEQKKRRLELEMREIQHKLEDLGAAFDTASLNLPENRKKRELHSKIRDLQGQIAMTDIYLKSVVHQIGKMAERAQNDKHDMQ